MAAGQPEERFWVSTPRVLSIVFSGVGDLLEREHQARAWLAWHTAALSRLKKLPELDTLTGRKVSHQVQSPEEMKAVFASMRRRARPA